MASVTESGPVPVSVLWFLISAPLLLEQRVPLGPLFFPALRTARVRQARQMCAQKQVFADWLHGDFSAFCCLALSYLSIIKLVWLVELEFPLAPRPSPSGPVVGGTLREVQEARISPIPTYRRS